MAEEDRTIVKIGEESFSIVEIPSGGTAIVQAETDTILGNVDLPTLVRDLGRVGNFVRIAYNGVAGYTELQITIRNIGYNVTKLCDKSSVTVSMFKQASRSIVGDLQGTYQFLLDGQEKMALVTLRSVADVAKNMSDAAKQLQTDFDKESKRVEEALNETMTAKGSEEKRKKVLGDTAKKLQIDKKKAIGEKETVEKDLKQAEGMYKAAERKQEAYESSATNPLKAIASALYSPFTYAFTRRHLFDPEVDLHIAEEARQEKLMYLDEMKEERRIRSKALQDIAEFAKKLENCKDDSELAEVAISALHNAMGGLQKLSAMMMKVIEFWTTMQMCCQNLANEKMQGLIVAALEMPKEERIRSWTSLSFKKNAIEYYAQWVALGNICTVYMGKIKETQRDLYGYLTENPTLDEARRNVRDLAMKFVEELAMEQKAIAEKDSADLEEQKKIESCIDAD